MTTILTGGHIIYLEDGCLSQRKYIQLKKPHGANYVSKTNKSK